MIEKKPTTALIQEAGVGVKWKTQRGFGVLMGGVVMDPLRSCAQRPLYPVKPVKTHMALILLLTAALTGCGDDLHEEAISRHTWEGSWPFTVPHGTLRCTLRKGTVPVVTFTAREIEFGVGDAAEAAGFPSVKAIRRRDRQGHFIDGDLDAVEQLGRMLCDDDLARLRRQQRSARP